MLSVADFDVFDNPGFSVKANLPKFPLEFKPLSLQV